MNAQSMAELADSAGRAAQLLKVMSNENRLMILCALIEQELSVSELNKLVPLSQSALSQHLAALRKAGLVSTRRDSQVIHYSICGEEASRILSVLKELFCP